MKLLFSVTLLITIVLQSYCQTNISAKYKGNRDINNFELTLTNDTEVNKIINLEIGSQLLASNSENSNFVLAKAYEFILSPKSERTESVIAYASDYTTFPDTGAVYQHYSEINKDCTPYLNLYQNQHLYGDNAQIKLWNSLHNKDLDTTKNYIYSFKKTIVFESENAGKIHLLALIDSIIIDTIIYQKLVGIGDYLLKADKIILSNIKGATNYSLVTQENKILYTTQKLAVVADTISFVYPFEYYVSRNYNKTRLEAYNSKDELIQKLFADKKSSQGKHISMDTINYYGLPTDTIYLRLFANNDKLLADGKAIYSSIKKTTGPNKNPKGYLNINTKYQSIKNAKRVECVILNERKEVLATIFENKNIHSGINKVKYTFEHQLPVGDIVYLVIRTSSGRVVDKKEYTIFK